MKFNYTTLGFLIVIVIVLGYYYTVKSNESGHYDNFAKCLTEKGISMGGTDWCSHCKDQKKMFGNSFKYVDYHNCDKERSWCDSKGIKGYPTWVFPGDILYSGTKSLRNLATLSDCELKYGE